MKDMNKTTYHAFPYLEPLATITSTMSWWCPLLVAIAGTRLPSGLWVNLVYSTKHSTNENTSVNPVCLAVGGSNTDRVDLHHLKCTQPYWGFPSVYGCKNSGTLSLIIILLGLIISIIIIIMYRYNEWESNRCSSTKIKDRWTSNTVSKTNISASHLHTWIYLC